MKALRDTMREGGISDDVPIVMAGGVWYLRDWNDWIDNPELGKIAFQFGTRPLLTRESPIPEGWKDKLTEIEPGEVLLHRFSPTGFYSSRGQATRSCAQLEARSERQIAVLDAGGGRPHLPARRRREGQEFLGDARRPAARARMVRPGLSPTR